jgi:predicted O-linked N-acetylglucosamine transferase (SPINDLY family)
VAQYIRSDQIDILLDITGHFSRSPLAVFALRPAPLQISIPGYPATTGLHAVDYKFVDRQTDPVGMTEHLYTEKLFRLRRPIACYAPPADSPAVTRLPARTNGFITFGSFNNRPKINGPLMSLWSRILQQIPGSRLLFHHTFNGYREVSRDFRDPIARHFRGQGVSGRRLEFIGALPIQEHLAAIAQADIALDSFPYNGLTTTCECLWMGVPVLTLAGRTHASRTGVSLLTGLGLEDWVTRSPDEYVRCAAAKARRVDALDRLREGLRTQMGQSSLVDGAGMIRALEDSFAKIWTRLAAPIPAPERRHAPL